MGRVFLNISSLRDDYVLGSRIMLEILCPYGTIEIKILIIIDLPSVSNSRRDMLSPEIRNIISFRDNRKEIKSF